jgi:hypothetical protein
MSIGGKSLEERHQEQPCGIDIIWTNRSILSHAFWTSFLELTASELSIRNRENLHGTMGKYYPMHSHDYAQAGVIS